MQYSPNLAKTVSAVITKATHWIQPPEFSSLAYIHNLLKNPFYYYSSLNVLASKSHLFSHFPIIFLHEVLSSSTYSPILVITFFLIHQLPHTYPVSIILSHSVPWTVYLLDCSWHNRLWRIMSCVRTYPELLQIITASLLNIHFQAAFPSSLLGTPCYPFTFHSACYTFLISPTHKTASESSGTDWLKHSAYTKRIS